METSIFIRILNKIAYGFTYIFKHSFIYRVFSTIGTSIANTFRNSYLYRFISAPSRAWKTSFLYRAFHSLVGILNRVFNWLNSKLKSTTTHSEMLSGLKVAYRRNLSNSLYFVGLSLVLFGIASSVISLLKNGAIINVWFTGSLLVLGFVLLLSHDVFNRALPNSFIYKLIYQFFSVEEVE